MVVPMWIQISPIDLDDGVICRYHEGEEITERGCTCRAILHPHPTDCLANSKHNPCQVTAYPTPTPTHDPDNDNHYQGDMRCGMRCGKGSLMRIGNGTGEAL